MKRTRRRVNRAQGRSIMMELPEPIVVDILSRLPAKTIFRCRRVCKTWRDILLDPHFATVHFSRAPVEFLLKSANRASNILLAELDEGSIISSCDVNFTVVRKSLINFKTFTSSIPICKVRSQAIEICSWCNGLICLNEKNTWNPYYVYNPITRETLIVPQTEKKSFGPNGCGLGFNVKCNEFKLLRFLYKYDSSKTVEAEIQTLGTNSWRSIGVAPSNLVFSSSAPFLNGALHWKTNGNEKELIFSFDFEEEKFQTLAAPSYFSDMNCKEVSHGPSLGLLGGYLCLSYHLLSRRSLDIWVMNEYGVKESWSKLLVIDNIFPAWNYQPIRFLKNGEILVLCDNQVLISYDPRRRSSRKLWFYQTQRCCQYFIIPHVPSFIRTL